MMEAIRSYLISVTAAALLSSVVMALTPQGSVRRVLSFLCGLVLILTVLGPVVRVDFEAMAGSIARTALRSEEVPEVEADNQALIASIIKETAETYIWDKAVRHGFSPTVNVTIRSDGEYPYPYGVDIQADCTAAQRRQLTREIEQELAIPAERQEWNTDETN